MSSAYLENVTHLVHPYGDLDTTLGKVFIPELRDWLVIADFKVDSAIGSRPDVYIATLSKSVFFDEKICEVEMEDSLIPQYQGEIELEPIVVDD